MQCTPCIHCLKEQCPVQCNVAASLLPTRMMKTTAIEHQQSGDVQQQSAGMYTHQGGCTHEWVRLTCKDSCLDSSPQGHYLVRVHTHIGLPACQLLHQLLYSWDTSGATNQNDLHHCTASQTSLPIGDCSQARDRAAPKAAFSANSNAADSHCCIVALLFAE